MQNELGKSRALRRAYFETHLECLFLHPPSARLMTDSSTKLDAFLFCFALLCETSQSRIHSPVYIIYHLPQLSSKLTFYLYANRWHKFIIITNYSSIDNPFITHFCFFFGSFRWVAKFSTFLKTDFLTDFGRGEGLLKNWFKVKNKKIWKFVTEWEKWQIESENVMVFWD